MKTYYLAEGISIIKIEIEKETDNYIWHKGRKNRKIQTYKRFFDNFEDAKAYLIKIRTDELEKLEYNRIKLKAEIDIIGGL